MLSKIRNSFLVQFAITLAILYVLFSVFFGVAIVNGDSMNPTLENRGLVFISHLKEPAIGDIIVFRVVEYDEKLVKRIIAKEGDVVDIDTESGVVTVNDIILDEPYIAEPTTTDLGGQFPLTVEKDCVFVMGDNRNNSVDSRSPLIGCVPKVNIEGTLLFLIFK